MRTTARSLSATAATSPSEWRRFTRSQAVGSNLCHTHASSNSPYQNGPKTGGRSESRKNLAAACGTSLEWAFIDIDTPWIKMKLQIDNLDGQGPRDYTAAIDSTRMPRVVRHLNKPSGLQVSLLANQPDFVVTVIGARITLGRMNGQDVFTGYLTTAPAFEYLGWDGGPGVSLQPGSVSDEAILDRKRLPERSPFVDRSAGNALRQMTADLLPGVFDTSAVQDVDTLASYAPDPQKLWTEHATLMALEARGSYRVSGGALIFSAVGAAEYAVSESDPNFSPDGLALEPVSGLVNDDRDWPDRATRLCERLLRRQQSHFKVLPFSDSVYQKQQILMDEEYVGTALDSTRWKLTDPANAVSVSNGQLQVAGGNGADGATTVVLAESVELGGAVVMQHGSVTFSAASTGVLGGLYPAAISIAGCLAGFQVTPNGAQCNIQALVNGAAAGAPWRRLPGVGILANDTILFAGNLSEATDISLRAAHRRAAALAEQQ